MLHMVLTYFCHITYGGFELRMPSLESKRLDHSATNTYEISRYNLRYLFTD